MAVLFLGGFAGLIVAVALQQRFGAGHREAPSHSVGVQVPVGAPPEPRAALPWRAQLSIRQAMLAQGHLVQRLRDGSRVTFGLDPDLQQTAERLLARYQVPYGSIVMLSVRTGRVLAMAGHSEANPKLSPIRLATQAWAPAASVFKLVTASALLERNRVRPLTRVCYHGGNRRLTRANLVDDKAKDKTCRTLADAIGFSLNAVVGKLARKLSRRELLETTNRFGWNARIDADIDLAPSRAMLPKEDLARAKVAAGFWHTTLSPLHGALIAQALANGGLMVRPRLVAALTGPDGKRRALPASWRRQVVTPFVAKVVGRMMVLTTTVGTARAGFHDRRGRAYLKGIKVAAKTGTLSRRNPALDYNWLIGFAPFDHPKVAFAILLGNPTRWRTKPHFLARQLLQAALGPRDARVRGAKKPRGGSGSRGRSPRRSIPVMRGR